MCTGHVRARASQGSGPCPLLGLKGRLVRGPGSTQSLAGDGVGYGVSGKMLAVRLICVLAETVVVWPDSEVGVDSKHVGLLKAVQVKPPVADRGADVYPVSVEQDFMHSERVDLGKRGDARLLASEPNHAAAAEAVGRSCQVQGHLVRNDVQQGGSDRKSTRLNSSHL